MSTHQESDYFLYVLIYVVASLGIGLVGGMFIQHVRENEVAQARAVQQESKEVYGNETPQDTTPSPSPRPKGKYYLRTI